MESDLSHLNLLVDIAHKKYGVKAISLMTIEEIKAMVLEVADEESTTPPFAKADELSIIGEEGGVTDGSTPATQGHLASKPSLSSNMPKALSIGASRKRFSECLLPG